MGLVSGLYQSLFHRSPINRQTANAVRPSSTVRPDKVGGKKHKHRRKKKHAAEMPDGSSPRIVRIGKYKLDRTSKLCQFCYSANVIASSGNLSFHLEACRPGSSPNNVVHLVVAFGGERILFNSWAASLGYRCKDASGPYDEMFVRLQKIQTIVQRFPRRIYRHAPGFPSKILPFSIGS